MQSARPGTLIRTLVLPTIAFLRHRPVGLRLLIVQARRSWVHCEDSHSTVANESAQGLRCYERIFEGSGADDCLRLLIGPIAPDDFNSSRMRSAGLNIPLSAHYAELLAELAHARGFDGWLLNFECPLAGGEQEARLVAAWITLLKDAMQRRVGAHSEVVWCALSFTR